MSGTRRARRHTSCSDLLLNADNGPGGAWRHPGLCWIARRILLRKLLRTGRRRSSRWHSTMPPAPSGIEIGENAEYCEPSGTIGWEAGSPTSRSAAVCRRLPGVASVCRLSHLAGSGACCRLRSSAARRSHCRMDDTRYDTRRGLPPENTTTPFLRRPPRGPLGDPKECRALADKIRASKSRYSDSTWEKDKNSEAARSTPRLTPSTDRPPTPSWLLEVPAAARLPNRRPPRFLRTLLLRHSRM